jgi:hypothetical protein
MALIKSIETGLYRIPLTVSLSDSTHGHYRLLPSLSCRCRKISQSEVPSDSKRNDSFAPGAALKRFDAPPVARTMGIG